MTISEIKNNALPSQSTGGKKVKEPVRSSRNEPDKIELSDEARSLFEAGQSKRLDEIRERIQNSFYFRPEITERVVSAIIKDMLKSDG